MKRLIVTDAEGMERTIRESDLDWTIVRPPQHTDKPFLARIASEGIICLDSASIFHGPMWPIASSRLSKIVPP